MTSDLTVTPMHIMLTVSDCDRSIAFYTDALGFSLGFEREAVVDFEPALELHDVKIREAFLVLRPMMLALMSFERPKVLPVPEHRMNEAGIKLIAFGVSDIDAVARRIADCGGAVLEQTRSESPDAILLQATDLDGNRLQLVQRKRPPMD